MLEVSRRCVLVWGFDGLRHFEFFRDLRGGIWFEAFKNSAGRNLCRAGRMGHLHTLALLLHGTLGPGAVGEAKNRVLISALVRSDSAFQHRVPVVLGSLHSSRRIVWQSKLYTNRFDPKPYDLCCGGGSDIGSDLGKRPAYVWG